MQGVETEIDDLRRQHKHEMGQLHGLIRNMHQIVRRLAKDQSCDELQGVAHHYGNQSNQATIPIRFFWYYREVTVMEGGTPK